MFDFLKEKCENELLQHEPTYLKWNKVNETLNQMQPKIEWDYKLHTVSVLGKIEIMIFLY